MYSKTLQKRIWKICLTVRRDQARINAGKLVDQRLAPRIVRA